MRRAAEEPAGTSLGGQPVGRAGAGGGGAQGRAVGRHDAAGRARPRRALTAPRMLPQERIVAKDALEHPYFANLDKATVGTIPLPI